MTKFIIAFVSGLFLLSSSSAANNLEESIVSSLQEFAQSSVQSVKLSCAPSRGPASVNKSYMVSFRSNSDTKTLLIQSEGDRVQFVSLVRDFVEFTRWKTFIPKEGAFRVDAVGKDKNVSELILNSHKPDYIKALESLAPKALDCCSNKSCRSKLK